MTSAMTMLPNRMMRPIIIAPPPFAMCYPRQILKAQEVASQPTSVQVARRTPNPQQLLLPLAFVYQTNGLLLSSAHCSDKRDGHRLIIVMSSRGSLSMAVLPDQSTRAAVRGVA